MKRWFGRWFGDTLFMRLFLLMWAALVLSHFAAYSVVNLVALGNPRFLDRLPTLPSLPPADLGRGRGPGPGGHLHPGGPPDGARPPAGAEGPSQLESAQDADGAPWRPPPPGASGRPPHPPHGAPPRLGGAALLLDYGVRMLVIALAAFFGARWLSAPMGRLVAASRALGGSLGAARPFTPLDETRGTVEVREAAHVFNTLAQRLRDFLSARALMVAAISHDLRTPMTRIRMRLEPSADEPASARSIADLQEMDGLIDDALAVFRGDEASEPPQPTDVQALVQSLVDDLAELGQAVELVGPPRHEPVVAEVRPVAVRRVVGNLVANALRYGERARVTVEEQAQAVTVQVDDDGPGIPPAQLEAVMQPFFRLEASRHRASGGAGLGLYIARDLAAREGGSLTLVNRVEGGLRATLVLPRG
jgi:protein-histidine pros-kinase